MNNQFLYSHSYYIIETIAFPIKVMYEDYRTKHIVYRYMSAITQIYTIFKKII